MDYLVTDTELTSVANAIRTKGGTSASLSFPTEFVQAINDIPTGSEPTGTKYIYTDETDITEAFDVGGYKYCSIDYSPVRDKAVRLWVEVGDNESIIVKLNSPQANTISIDWGDGTQGYADWDNTHTYSQSGRYCIELKANDVSNDALCLSNSALGQTSSAHNTTLVAVEYCALNYKIWGQQSDGSNCFVLCDNLKKATFSFGRTTISSMGSASSLFANCPSLETVDFFEGMPAMPSFICQNCTSLKRVTIPSTVTEFDNSCFKGCTALEEVHLLPTTPPKFNNMNSLPFNGVSANCVFYVPQASLSAYQSSQYWSAYASKMVGE